MSIPNDQTLNTILQSKPYMVNIEGSVNICMTLCGQDIQACNQVEWVSMKNMNSWLVIEPKMNASAKCSIKLAFDSESSTGKGGDGYILEKVLISTPAYHRMNSKLFDLEVFMLYSSTQSDGTKVYVCMCSLYNGADTVAQNDWRHTTYRLMNELFGNVDKIPAKGQTMGIGSPPNPIDMENLIPREGFRNFYEYTHPNNTKVNFRIFSSPMLVSNAVLKNLQMKLYTGAEYANAKQAILQATNPADGLFIFFSQDVTRNIDSVLNGQLLEPNACPIVKEKTVAKKVSGGKKVKSTPSKKSQTTKKKETKSTEKKKETKSTEKKKGTKTDKKKKNTKEKFSNQEDSENEDEEEDFENEDDEEEDFENEEIEEEDFENEDDEEEDFENEEDEEEGFAEISGEQNKKETKSGSITATIVVSIVFSIILYQLSFLDIIKNIGLPMWAKVLIFILIVGGSGTATYYATDTTKVYRKNEEKREENLEKQKNARTTLMFALGFMIITPYFFFALMNKLMNDPTFEGLGNYNFDPNEVLKLLNDPDFKKIIQAKLIYMIILVIQVFLSFGLILSLMMKNTGDTFMTFMNLASTLGVSAFLSIIYYMWCRSSKPFDNYAVSELDYYSVLSMGIKNWYVLLFDSSKPLDVSELLIGDNTNGKEQPSASAPPASSVQFVQQGGNVTPNTIRTGIEVPGLNKEDLDKTLKKMGDKEDEKGNWGALLQSISPLGMIITIFFFVMFTILWITLISLLVSNHTDQIQTTTTNIGLTLGYGTIIITAMYLLYAGGSYIKEMKERMAAPPISKETLKDYEPMEYVQFTDARGRTSLEKLPRSMVDEIMQENQQMQKVDGILSVSQNDLHGIDLKNEDGKKRLASVIQIRKEEEGLRLQEVRESKEQGQPQRQPQRQVRSWRDIIRRPELQPEEPEMENGLPLETPDMRRVRRVRAGTQLQAENQGRTGTPSMINRATSFVQGLARPPAREGDAINPPAIGMIGRRRPSIQMVSNVEGGIDGQRGDITQGSGDDAGVLAPMIRSAKRQMQRLSGLGAANDAFRQTPATSGGEELSDEGGPLPAMTRSATRQLKRMGGLGAADDSFRQTPPPTPPRGSGDEGSVMRALGRMRGALPLSGLHEGDENGGMAENENDETGRVRDEDGILGKLGRMRGVLPMSSLSSDDEGIQGDTHRLRGVETGDESQLSDMNRSRMRSQRRTKRTINPENFDPRVIDESRIRSRLAEF
jgi:hypothetical protein